MLVRKVGRRENRREKERKEACKVLSEGLQLHSLHFAFSDAQGYTH